MFIVKGHYVHIISNSCNFLCEFSSAIERQKNESQVEDNGVLLFCVEMKTSL